MFHAASLFRNARCAPPRSEQRAPSYTYTYMHIHIMICICSICLSVSLHTYIYIYIYTYTNHVVHMPTPNAHPAPPLRRSVDGGVWAGPPLLPQQTRLFGRTSRSRLAAWEPHGF